MRIHHYVSIIFAIAIGGAVGLALIVGRLAGGLEGAAHESGKAADQYHQVHAIVSDGQDLVEAISTLTVRSSEESFALIDQSIDRSLADLLRLRHAPLLVEADRVRDALNALQQSRSLAASRGDDVRDPDELERFRHSLTAYVMLVAELDAAAAMVANDTAQTLVRRRRAIMLTIAVICIFYLLVIERIRHWTARRLIHPVETLAEAAKQAMKGAEELPILQQRGVEELNTLADVLTSFVDTVKVKVRERTAQVERQKESLEREVRVRRQAEEQLRHAAFHDKLTGLCNRDLLLDRLERCLERARRQEDYDVAVLFIDIDGFKEVNDRLGHINGDQLLISIAERFGQCLRDVDTVTRLQSNTIARIGGDEFVVLLDGIKARPDARQVAERLQETLAEPFRLLDNEVQITASIGIAYNEGESKKADHLLRDADTAMYYAKATGKARSEVFDKKMHAAATARLQVGNELRRAIENREFKLVYQPIICLKTGRLSGFEALARWEDPERGEISPVEFIPDAEETGVILQLGQWVIEEACRQLRAWQEQVGRRRKLSVSVNVSKQQVAQRGLVDTVGRILSSTGVPGSCLNLEITESAIMEKPESIAEVLARLKDLEVEIHMDDFGTGYSSLSYLHRFPLDVLKIDRAFVSMLSANHNYAEVINTVVAMAHALNMKVTVEGVMTIEQLVQLKALKCNYAQGYYFSEPLEAPAATAIIRSEPKWLKSAA